MSPRTGRPLSDNPRNERVEIKMNADELAKLNFCCEITGKTRSEVIREGIDVVYAKLCQEEAEKK